jgi:hypothetical protein
MQRTLLALALIVTAGASFAQTMPTNEPRDPYGRPLIGRNDWVRQPGDQPGNAGAAASVNSGATINSGATVNSDANMAAAPMPAQSGPHQPAFKDEYGFRYDAQGNRLDARGNIISPQTR